VLFQATRIAILDELSERGSSAQTIQEASGSTGERIRVLAILTVRNRKNGQRGLFFICNPMLEVINIMRLSISTGLSRANQLLREVEHEAPFR
jgi:hypothetical protein